MTKTMKASLVVTSPDGTVWSGEVDLSADGADKPARKKVLRVAATSSGLTASDLELPARAFFKKFANKATAAGKFALVVAHIARGATGKEVDTGEIEKVWNQNSGVLGGAYQTMYGTRSKEKGWVNSTKRGVFVLMDGWQKAANG
jgi:hypothetical protein